MGREPAAGRAARLQRVDNVHWRQRPQAALVGLARAARDFAQRRGQPGRVARKACRRGIGQVLALARAGEVEHLGEDRSDDRRHQRDLQHDHLRLAAAAGAAPPAAVPEHAQEQVGQQNDAAHHHRRQRHEPHIQVADVGDLVRHDALQLVAVQPAEQAGGDGDAGPFRLAADGEGVGRVVVDQVDPRHLAQAGGDRHLLDDVEQTRGVLLLDRPRAGAGQHELLAAGIGGQQQHEPDDECRHRAQANRVGTGDRAADQRAQPDEQHAHQADQPPRAALIRSDRFPHVASLRNRGP